MLHISETVLYCLMTNQPSLNWMLANSSMGCGKQPVEFQLSFWTKYRGLDRRTLVYLEHLLQHASLSILTIYWSHLQLCGRLYTPFQFFIPRNGTIIWTKDWKTGFINGTWTRLFEINLMNVKDQKTKQSKIWNI